MNKEKFQYILNLLNQVGGPVKITYQTQQITLISEELINYHILKIKILLESTKNFYEEYTISDIYSLYMCLNYIITDLGIDEFEIITGKNFYDSGLRFLSDIKQEVMNYGS